VNSPASFQGKLIPVGVLMAAAQSRAPMLPLTVDCLMRDAVH
jgi:hypothetical protein